MSIILKALKSAPQKEDQEGDSFLGKEEGFFQGSSSVVKKPPFRGFQSLFFSKGSLVLTSLLALLLGFSFAFRWLQNRSRPQRIPTIVEIAPPPQPAQVPSPQTQEDSVEAMTDQMNEAFEAEDYGTSAELLKQLLIQKPNDAGLHNNLGFVFYRQGLLTNASTEYQKALELDGECAECFNNLGLLKSSLGEVVEAKKYFEKAMQLAVDYADPYFNLAVLYEHQGDVGHAVQYYRQFVERCSDSQSEIIVKVRKRISELTL